MAQGAQNPAIMEPDEQDFQVGKEDRDSGIDNTSHSCSEEPSRTSSVTDDVVKSEEKIHTLEPSEFHHHIDIITITCPHWKDECSVKMDEHAISSDLKEPAVLEVDSITEHNNNAGAPPYAYLEDFPEYFKDLFAKGINEPADYSVTINDKPEWLNVEKFKRGQKFALDNLSAINFAECCTLLLLFAMKNVLNPFIFTGKSDTPFKCFKRYLSTHLRVNSWYQDHIWSNESNNGRTNLNIVRGMHQNVESKFSSTTQEEYEKKTTIWRKADWSSNFPLRDVVEDDFKGTCPMVSHHQFLNEQKVGILFNQAAMVFAQFSFVGLAVTYPKKFGMHYATDEDLEAFIHVWRGIGHLLGIKDEFNFCNADLATVRQRTFDIIDLFIKPSLRNPTADWEYMSRCLIDGVRFYTKLTYFEPSLLFICNVLKLHTPRLKSFVGFKSYWYYHVVKFYHDYLCRIRFIFKFFNYFVIKSIGLANKVSSKTLRKYEAKEFSYVPENTYL